MLHLFRTVIVVMIAITFVILYSAITHAQSTLQLKPLASQWAPSDISAIELRVRGRLVTDSAGTNKILGRINIGTLDWFTFLTKRVTILPAQQWEVKSFSLLITPKLTTNLASLEIVTRNLPLSYVAPAGQTMAIDIDTKTGILLVGSAAIQPPPPPPPPVTQGQLGIALVRWDTSGGMVMTMSEGAVIVLAALPSRNLTFAALTQTQNWRTVEFWLDGVKVNDEGQYPYVMCGDWNPCPQVPGAVGSHVVRVVPIDSAGTVLPATNYRYTVQ